MNICSILKRFMSSIKSYCNY